MVTTRIQIGYWGLNFCNEHKKIQYQKTQSNLSYPPSKKELLYNPDLTHYRAEAATLYAESGGNKREARRRFIANHPGINRYDIPDCKFFERNNKKFKAKHTVKNVVSCQVF